MANVRIAGNVAIITSSMTLDGLKRVGKHRPNSLEIRNEKDEVIFKVGTGSNALSAYGASFNAATLDEREFAYISLTIPADVMNAKRWFAETHGTSYAQLKHVEAMLVGVVREVENEIAEIMDEIQLADNTPNTVSTEPTQEETKFENTPR